jgi:hypothetical protein
MWLTSPGLGQRNRSIADALFSKRRRAVAIRAPLRMIYIVIQYNTSLLRPVGQRPMGSEAKGTYASLGIIALLSSSPYDSRLVPSSLVIALLLGPPWC